MLTCALIFRVTPCPFALYANYFQVALLLFKTGHEALEHEALSVVKVN